MVKAKEKPLCRFGEHMTKKGAREVAGAPGEYKPRPLARG